MLTLFDWPAPSRSTDPPLVDRVPKLGVPLVRVPKRAFSSSENVSFSAVLVMVRLRVTVFPTRNYRNDHIITRLLCQALRQSVDITAHVHRLRAQVNISNNVTGARTVRLKTIVAVPLLAPAVLVSALPRPATRSALLVCCAPSRLNEPLAEASPVSPPMMAFSLSENVSFAAVF